MKMKRHSIPTCILTLVILFSLSDIYAQARRITNPETRRRYIEALKDEAKARNEEAEAWNNYNRKVDQARNDVRSVRDGALKGVITGGAVGAARGATKEAGKAIIDRVESTDYYNRKVEQAKQNLNSVRDRMGRGATRAVGAAKKAGNTIINRIRR
jgi:F0F1-type ATP synthase membrane subunit b/b'